MNNAWSYDDATYASSTDDEDDNFSAEYSNGFGV